MPEVPSRRVDVSSIPASGRHEPSFGRLMARHGAIARPAAEWIARQPGLEGRGWADGAGDEVRTRDMQLGRLPLCQLSYSRPRRGEGTEPLGFDDSQPR